MPIDPLFQFSYHETRREARPDLENVIMKKRVKHQCPECGYPFSWKQRTDFLKGLGFIRCVVPCPQCSTPLVWLKWPFVVQNLTILFYLVAIGLMMAGFGHGGMIPYLVGGAVLIFGVLQFTERLVRADGLAPEQEGPQEGPTDIGRA